MEKQEMAKVSVIGLGMMGSSIAAAFLKSRATVSVWNRDESKAAKIVELGACVMATAEEAILASPVTVICVSESSIAAKILSGDGVLTSLKGKTIVQLSTGTPDQERKIQKLLINNGANSVNGAIMAWPGQIGEAATTILVSCPQDIYNTHEPLLKALAGNLTYMGEEPGSSAALFAAVLSYLAGNWIGFCHGALVCKSEGLRVDDFGQLIQQISPILAHESKNMGEVIQFGRFTNPESTVHTTGHDLDILVAQARDRGISVELPKFAADIFRRAIDAGFGGEEHAAIIKVMQP
ncbi:MAG: NAD(P)-binding domain-containing protein [Chryseolinea sp.]